VRKGERVERGLRDLGADERRVGLLARLEEGRERQLVARAEHLREAIDHARHRRLVPVEHAERARIAGALARDEERELSRSPGSDLPADEAGRGLSACGLA
jgi:hypothetical protein